MQEWDFAGRETHTDWIERINATSLAKQRACCCSAHDVGHEEEQAKGTRCGNSRAILMWRVHVPKRPCRLPIGCETSLEHVYRLLLDIRVFEVSQTIISTTLGNRTVNLGKDRPRSNTKHGPRPPRARYSPRSQTYSMVQPSPSPGRRSPQFPDSPQDPV